MPSDVQQEISKKIENCFLIAERFYQKSFTRPIDIIFKRSGTTAGHCNYSKKELMFQLDLAEHNATEFINQIVPHEVAHYIQRAVYGYNANVKTHGREWKFIMSRVFNIRPDRCHAFDTSVTKTKRKKRFEYRCNCKSHEITSIMHNRMLLNKKRYMCCLCRTEISFIKPI